MAITARAPAADGEDRGQGCPLQPGEERSVVRIIDPDTILLDGGTEVRLLAALGPRPFDASAGPTAWPPAEATIRALEAHLTGRNVRLAFAGRRTDRYGRSLAHVFIGAETEPIWLQRVLLQSGMARVYALDGSDPCMSALVTAENAARGAGIGLWRDAAYAVRSAEDTTALLRLAGTFQIVEGRVVDVSEIRGTTYLNFGDDWRQDFTAILRQPVRRAMLSVSLKAEDLKGERVRVRGWIERRGGPMIDVLHAALIERLPPEAAIDPSPRAGPRRRARRQPP
jgi:endonuclease YncB( thermonuclease family)